MVTRSVATPTRPPGVLVSTEGPGPRVHHITSPTDRGRRHTPSEHSIPTHTVDVVGDGVVVAAGTRAGARHRVIDDVATVATTMVAPTVAADVALEAWCDVNGGLLGRSPTFRTAYSLPPRTRHGRIRQILPASSYYGVPHVGSASVTPVPVADPALRTPRWRTRTGTSESPFGLQRLPADYIHPPPSSLPPISAETRA